MEQFYNSMMNSFNYFLGLLVTHEVRDPENVLQMIAGLRLDLKDLASTMIENQISSSDGSVEQNDFLNIINEEIEIIESLLVTS